MLQINKCLEIQLKMAEKGVSPIPRLGELLVEHGFVDKKDRDGRLEDAG